MFKIGPQILSWIIDLNFNCSISLIYRLGNLLSLSKELIEPSTSSVFGPVDIIFGDTTLMISDFVNPLKAISFCSNGLVFHIASDYIAIPLCRTNSSNCSFQDDSKLYELLCWCWSIDMENMWSLYLYEQ